MLNSNSTVHPLVVAPIQCCHFNMLRGKKKSTKYFEIKIPLSAQHTLVRLRLQVKRLAHIPIQIVLLIDTYKEWAYPKTK